MGEFVLGLTGKLRFCKMAPPLKPQTNPPVALSSKKVETSHRVASRVATAGSLSRCRAVAVFSSAAG